MRATGEHAEVHGLSHKRGTSPDREALWRYAFDGILQRDDNPDVEDVRDTNLARFLFAYRPDDSDLPIDDRRNYYQRGIGSADLLRKALGTVTRFGGRTFVRRAIDELKENIRRRDTSIGVVGGSVPKVRFLGLMYCVLGRCPDHSDQHRLGPRYRRLTWRNVFTRSPSTNGAATFICTGRRSFTSVVSVVVLVDAAGTCTVTAEDGRFKLDSVPSGMPIDCRRFIASTFVSIGSSGCLVAAHRCLLTSRTSTTINP